MVAQPRRRPRRRRARARAVARPPVARGRGRCRSAPARRPRGRARAVPCARRGLKGEQRRDVLLELEGRADLGQKAGLLFARVPEAMRRAGRDGDPMAGAGDEVLLTELEPDRARENLEALFLRGVNVRPGARGVGAQEGLDDDGTPARLRRGLAEDDALAGRRVRRSCRRARPSVSCMARSANALTNRLRRRRSSSAFSGRWRCRRDGAPLQIEGASSGAAGAPAPERERGRLACAGDRLPLARRAAGRAVNAVQVAIHGLRRVLGGERIETRGSGYSLRARAGRTRPASVPALAGGGTGRARRR